MPFANVNPVKCLFCFWIEVFMRDAKTKESQITDSKRS